MYSIGSAKLPEEMENLECTGFLDAQGVKSLFDSLDLLISAAGQTIAEAVSCALPIIMINTVDNQCINYKGWNEKYYVALKGGDSSNRYWLENLKDCIGLAKQKEIRQKLQNNARQLNMFLSTKRLVDKIC